MPELLVSVRNAAEAALAYAAGCGWVDVKEPRRGPLGRAEETVWREVAAALDRSAARLTLALGDAADPVPDRLDVPAAAAVVKLGPIGLPTDGRHDGLLAAVRARRAAWEHAAGRPLPWAGVAYLDRGPNPEALAAVSRELGDRFFLCDTADKSGPTALEQLAGRPLPPVPGATVCLAGRLRRDQLAAALALPVDLVGVRSAVCDGDRRGTIDAGRLREVMGASRVRPERDRAASPSN